MNQVNKTLYIPLYGKAYVSCRGILLADPKAEAIWASESFPLKGKSKSKWLAFYMGIRAAVFDSWMEDTMKQQLDAVILHIGCGMDSRVERVGTGGHLWYDLDFPEVIGERKRYYTETDDYKMIAADVRETAWLEGLPKGSAIIVMEGVSMYLTPEQLSGVLANFGRHFEKVFLLMDCYTEFAAKASRYKNPINDVGVTKVFGLDDPCACIEETKLRFQREHDMMPQVLIDELKGMEKAIFRSLYAGSLARRLYKLYEYRKD